MRATGCQVPSIINSTILLFLSVFFPQREENRLFVLNPLSTWLADSYEDTKGGGEPEGCIAMNFYMHRYDVPENTPCHLLEAAGWQFSTRCESFSEL